MDPFPILSLALAVLSRALVRATNMTAMAMPTSIASIRMTIDSSMRVKPSEPSKEPR